MNDFKGVWYEQSSYRLEADAVSKVLHRVEGDAAGTQPLEEEAADTALIRQSYPTKNLYTT